MHPYISDTIFFQMPLVLICPKIFILARRKYKLVGHIEVESLPDQAAVYEKSLKVCPICTICKKKNINMNFQKTKTVDVDVDISLKSFYE